LDRWWEAGAATGFSEQICPSPTERISAGGSHANADTTQNTKTLNSQQLKDQCPMTTDIQDLRGVYPTPVRWSAETGQLGYSTFDPAAGERSIEVIELGSQTAKFVMDLATRERGYGLIRAGHYEMRFSPVNSPPPPWPGDDDFKPAIGCWLWNPPLGELRLETNATLFRTAVSSLWDHCRTFAEAAQGLQPVIHFVDRQERLIKSIGKVFLAPVVTVIGWVPREKCPTFVLREPTVKPPLAIDSQLMHALLEHLHREEPKPARGKTKTGAALKRGSLDELLNDEIPSFDR
jgi:hypothetical protein